MHGIIFHWNFLFDGFDLNMNGMRTFDEVNHLVKGFFFVVVLSQISMQSIVSQYSDLLLVSKFQFNVNSMVFLLI